MWISIRTKRINISPRTREKIERVVRRSFERQRRYIGSVVVNLAPARRGRDLGYDCRITLWSHCLGLLVATDSGDTIRTAVQQTLRLSRETFRQRLHKRRTALRRASRSRIPQRLADTAMDGLSAVERES